MIHVIMILIQDHSQNLGNFAQRAKLVFCCVLKGFIKCIIL